ncbi:BamA/TamA family outer membrane protein [Bacteroides caecimuris]|uniref:translocation and assembly module lipoprotein TamL n=1 Tax=Bacteroides caecimuris TaxID=1796613 RepID=UPI0026EA72C9|nr:BamA/TamA family outer membrane protein [Bacteroides caecimuris]
MRYYLYICTFLCVIGLASCSSTKYVPDGSFLLNDINIKNGEEGNKTNVNHLKNYVRQKSNSSWFSTLKIPLATYSVSGRDSSKWINRILKSMGEAPILYDSLKAIQSCNDLRAKMRNDGYLDAEIAVSTRKKGKKIDITYLVFPGEPYVLKDIKYDIRDTVIAGLLKADKNFVRGLRPGTVFNVNSLDQERKRIVDKLINNGYYRFNKDFITYNADTVSGSKDINLTLLLHKYQDQNQKADTLHRRYTIRNVVFQSGDPEDSVIHLRKKVLINNTFIESGQPYSAKELQKTYNHFGRLQAVKYTNIGFREIPDSSLLDCRIQISTNKPSTISFQPEGTNTAGDLGAALSLTYQTKNLFRGSELLSLEFRGAYEAIKGLEGYANENFEEYGAEARLLFPRFIAPFLSRKFRRRVTATSEVSISYNLQNRPEYHRRVLSAAWRYKWNDANHHDKYQIDLLDLNYVSMPWISERFRTDYLENATSRNAILRYNYENLFIMKFGLGYSYNNGRYAIKAYAETAGNLLNLSSHVLGASRNDLGVYQLFNIAFAQYAKADFEYTKNWKIDYNNTLVFHFGLGVAYPYGNSTILPFEKRYFSGGANSVRGWNVRGLGPGRYVERDGNINFINQTGDMKIDLNIEYRTHLFWKFNGALFVDAGNIWTLREYPEQQGGMFRFDHFVKDMAVSYGMGLRFNFDYFILRFDFGMKAVNPVYTTKKEHYPIINPKLSRDLTFHFAVGLPF